MDQGAVRFEYGGKKGKFGMVSHGLGWAFRVWIYPFCFRLCYSINGLGDGTKLKGRVWEKRLHNGENPIVHSDHGIVRD